MREDKKSSAAGDASEASTAALDIEVIRPRPGWESVDWRELLRYRDLCFFLVLRDIKVLYKQTVLGFGWAVIRPVAMMVVFSVVFGGLAEVPSDDLPYTVFSFAAVVPWSYFQNATTMSIQSLLTNAPMFTKVYFPRIVIPLTPVFASLVDFLIAFVILILMMLWYGIYPTWNLVILPLFVLLMIMTAAGIGMWLSALAIQYRDIKHAVPFLVQLLMYAAPVVWPASLIETKFPEHYELIRLVYGAYPMAGVVEGFRAALLGKIAIPWDLIGMGFLSSVFILTTGLFYFRRKERIFADVY